MTILDEREQSVSLKLIVVMVTVVTLAGFAALFALNSMQAAPHGPAQAQTSGNI